MRSGPARCVGRSYSTQNETGCRKYLLDQTLFATRSFAKEGAPPIPLNEASDVSRLEFLKSYRVSQGIEQFRTSGELDKLLLGKTLSEILFLLEIEGKHYDKCDTVTVMLPNDETLTFSQAKIGRISTGLHSSVDARHWNLAKGIFDAESQVRSSSNWVLQKIAGFEESTNWQIMFHIVAFSILFGAIIAK